MGLPKQFRGQKIVKPGAYTNPPYGIDLMNGWEPRFDQMLIYVRSDQGNGNVGEWEAAIEREGPSTWSFKLVSGYVQQHPSFPDANHLEALWQKWVVPQLIEKP